MFSSINISFDTMFAKCLKKITYIISSLFPVYFILISHHMFCHMFFQSSQRRAASTAFAEFPSSSQPTATTLLQPAWCRKWIPHLPHPTTCYIPQDLHHTTYNGPTYVIHGKKTARLCKGQRKKTGFSPPLTRFPEASF